MAKRFCGCAYASQMKTASGRWIASSIGHNQNFNPCRATTNPPSSAPRMNDPDPDRAVDQTELWRSSGRGRPGRAGRAGTAGPSSEAAPRRAGKHRMKEQQHGDFWLQEKRAEGLGKIPRRSSLEPASRRFRQARRLPYLETHSSGHFQDEAKRTSDKG